MWRFHFRIVEVYARYVGCVRPAGQSIIITESGLDKVTLKFRQRVIEKREHQNYRKDR